METNHTNATIKSKYVDIQPFQGVILGIIATPGIIGNAFAIAATVKLLKVQKLAPNVFIIGLACCDLVGILATCIPTWICYAFKGWQGGAHLCRFQGFVTLLFTMGSGLVATSMSVDRLLSIKAPFFHRTYATVNAATKLVVAIMIFSAIFAIMPVFGFGSFVLNLTGTYCTINWFAHSDSDKAFSYMYATIGILMILAVVLCNAVVIFLLLKKKKLRRKLSGTFHNQIKKKSSNDKLQQQFSRMMMIISLLFLICWTPFMFRIVGNISGVWISWSADLNASRMLLLNLVLDPFIYVLTRKYYRDTLKEILCCICCKSNEQRYLSVKKSSSSSGTEMVGNKLSSNPSLHKVDKIEENCVQEITAEVSSTNKLLVSKNLSNSKEIETNNGERLSSTELKTQPL